MNKKKIIGLISVLVILLVGGVGFTLYNKPVKAPENIVTLDLTLNENTYYIDTKDYELTMQEVVEPYLDAIVKSDYLISKDGAKIHYRQYLNPEAKGEIVISHGLTEAAEKYKEVIYYFIQEGYSVHIAEHRSHGLSERLVEDKSKVHINDFDVFVEDFHQFIADIVEPTNESKPMFLFAHSMGGGIGSLFLERYPEYFDAAVLTAPMMAINTGTYPEIIAKTIADAMVLVGQGEQYVLGDGPFTGESNFERSSSGSIERYEYYFDKRLEHDFLQTSGSSFSWLKESIEATKEIVKKENASLAVTPTLLFQAELDHLVKPEGHYEYVKNATNTSLIFVPGAKHEIFNCANEIMIPYYNTIFKFFESYLN